jgi:NAD-dependent deacetylase
MTLSDYLKAASRILIFTGAGVSTKSGIRDYRGPKGLWKTEQPVYYQEFMTDPDARNRYWQQKLESWPVIRDAVPTETHRACVELEKMGKLLMVVTQNIDGLHRKAGTSLPLLVEIHGTTSMIECQNCHTQYDPDPLFEIFSKTKQAPECECGGYLKPATISFGQNLKQEDLERAYSAANRADLVISLGSTLSVTPAATIPLITAERGVPYVIVNSGPTDHDRLEVVSLRLEGDVDAIFPPAVHTLS